MTQTQTDNNLRYERKCRIEGTEKQEILYYIKHHPAFFKPIFKPRQINNVYFDTQQLQYYKANKIGIAERKKIRIRWYGTHLGIAQKPQLEIKLKSGLVGDKLVFPLPAFELPRQLSADFFIQLVTAGRIPNPIMYEMQLLQPVLINTYQRSYFQSIDKKFRLTLDEDMTFYRPNNWQKWPLKSRDLPTFILELKYVLAADKDAAVIFQHWPYRLSKNSKYVNGIDWLE